MNKIKQITRPALALLITLGFFAVVAFLIKGAPPENQALLVLLGYLGASFQNAVSYYFGSTETSKDKDEIIAGMAKK